MISKENISKCLDFWIAELLDLKPQHLSSAKPGTGTAASPLPAAVSIFILFRV